MLRIKYQILRMLRNKSCIFWALLFPIFLGALFFFMFGNIDNLSRYSSIPVAIVNADKSDGLADIMEIVTTDEDKKMFEVKYCGSMEDAQKVLKNDRVEGIIDAADDYALTVKESEVTQTVIKTFIDQYKQNTALIAAAGNDPSKLMALANELSSGSNTSIKNIELKGIDKDPYSQYFYALLAMTCLIMSNLGLTVGIDLQADMSALGARRNVSPQKKIKMIIEDFTGAFIISILMAVIVLFVCIFAYKRDFGSNTGLVLLSTIAGCFTGIAAGMLIGVTVKGNAQKKEGLCTTFFMVSSFLAGLQWADITYYIEKNCSIINRINPATLIVNSYKSLAVFGDYSQYWINVGTLLVIGVIFLIISAAKMRGGRKYADL